MASTKTQHLTADDLWQMPGHPRRELVKGRLIDLTPADDFQSGEIKAKLSLALSEHVRRQHLGAVVGGGTGFVLTHDPDTVRGVDCGFVSNARLPKGGRLIGYFPGPPDLAVEVVSPGDTLAEVEDKVDDYLRAGAKLVWVVNPRRRTVTIHRPDAEPTLLAVTETLTAGDVLPDFKCSVAEIFA